MLIRIIFIFLFTIFYASGHPQKFLSFPTYDVDSILAILPNQFAEERINSLNKLATSLSFIDAELSKQYTAEAMKLSAEISYEEGH